MAFDTIPELKPQGLKAIAYMVAKGYKVRALNIMCFEGINTDLLTVNNDKIDLWDDVRAIVSDKGEVLMACQATTKAGWYYRQNPLNDDGCAQIAFGQYLDCWRIGMHHAQKALVQCGTIKIYRDKNEDGSRAGDACFTGDDFGINLHTTGNEGSDNAPDTVGRWSAGCSVGRYSATHYGVFMPICRAMGLDTFDVTFVDGSDFHKFCQN